MSDSIQTQGKTVNDAVSEALLQLGLRRDEVEIKVIEEPKSGLLGFIGGRPAKVMVRKKPARRRGRRDSNSGDDQAHSLSGGGRGGRSRGGRGGRSRGGRDNRPDNRQEEQQDNRQESRGGRSRGGRRDQEKRQDTNEVRAEGREDNRGRGRDGGRNEGGGNSRGRRSRQDNRADSARDDSSRNDSQRNDNSRGGGRDGRQESRQEGRQSSSRRGGRGRGRGDDQVTVERSEEKTSRSRRGSRGGRGRGRGDQREGARRNEATDSNVSVNEAPVNATPVNEKPVNNVAASIDASVIEQNPSAQVERDRSASSEKQTYASPRMDDTPAAVPNNEEKTNMTNDDQKSAPAAATTPEAPTPVTKPKAKRKGWGGGLGSRLPRKTNPAVKNKPETVVIKEAAAPAPAPRSREPRDDSRGRSDSRDRGEYRDRRPSAAADEVIIDAVAATKYAKPVAGVTDETLDGALAELASGMLARAGFPCEVEVNEGEYRQVRISSDEESAGMLIGRHGQTVDAVEHLVERMACNAVDDRVRMNLDINGYRERRSESLQERVADAVAEVRETGRAYHVEPMSARERRLVHLEVESVEGIRTFTMVGSGGKYVVIALDDEADDRQQNED